MVGHSFEVARAVVQEVERGFVRSKGFKGDASQLVTEVRIGWNLI